MIESVIERESEGQTFADMKAGDLAVVTEGCYKGQVVVKLWGSNDNNGLVIGLDGSCSGWLSSANLPVRICPRTR